MENICAARLTELRRLMASRGWDALLLGSSDPHESEYVSPRWQQIRWLSGFVGEAAELVVTDDAAGLWVDSRYFISAAAQLEGTGIELHRKGLPDSDTPEEFLAAREAAVLAVDGKALSYHRYRSLQEAFCRDGSEIVNSPDILDLLWKDRPAVPATPLRTLDEASIGETRKEKIAWLRERLAESGADSMMVSALDEIAWLLNVRASDIDYNPLAVSYLYISQDSAVFFALKENAGQEDCETSASLDELRRDGIRICGYEDISIELSSMDSLPESEVLAVDPSTLNTDLYLFLASRYPLLKTMTSPIPLRKAVKNPSEIGLLRDIWVEDGLAMERFLFWLEGEVASGREVDEWEASEKLSSLRAAIPGYQGDSFENISAYGPSAALPHYSTPRKGSRVIRPEGLYLIDSGGQYLSGTTDITRTVPMGPCTFLEREDYTLVLKGMIQLSMAVFPHGTAGCQVDAAARMPLWRALRNYGHGTGHGVGFFLGVHEGPQSIRQNFLSQPLLPGMVTSNEPGLYREGSHGIRHENVVLCCEKGSNEFGRWLGFETLTCCHIDTAAVETRLLSPEERDWLNAYNASVWQRLGERLPDEEKAWLRLKTLPV